jgi:DNA ligase-1
LQAGTTQAAVLHLSHDRERTLASVLLARVVETSADVAATRARNTKIAALATLLREAPDDEVATVVCLLTGEPRQGRIGIGWRTMSKARDAVTLATTPSLTVTELDRAIDEVQATTGPGSVGARQTVLTSLLARATPAEAEFVMALFTGGLRQGALAGLMADAIAKASDAPPTVVRRAAMLGGDLAETALLAMQGGEEALTAVGLQVLRPVLPMLAATAADVGEALTATGVASVEWKLDGARIQVHRRGDEVRLYTRNLNDITTRLPEVVELVRSFPADSFVLDGETIGLTEDALPHAFQDTMSRFGRDDSGSHAMTLTAFFFDIMHLDGEDLLDRPLRERAARLTRLVGDARVPAVETADAGVASEFLATALATGHEGVMVKGLDSRYEAGRRGAQWRKVKPVKTLDLVVLGAEWGHGRRQGWLSNLHLGARDAAGEFVMVGKTFKGLTDELLAWQTEKLQERKVREEGITVFVRPELVVEIALDSVQASTRYPGGVALRFARVRGYRPDKGPADVDRLDTVRALLPR